MKSYGVNNRETRKRIKKTHFRAKCAGLLYLLGAFAVVLFTFMPILSWVDETGARQSLSLGTCLNSFGLTSIFYLITLFGSVISLL